MKKTFFLKLSVACLIMLACSSESLYEDLSYLPEKVPMNDDVCTFVSSEQANSVAQAFLSRHTDDTALRSRIADAETMVTTVDKDGAPQMYIINFPEGGWVIVSATRNFYPILAYSDEGSFELSEDMGGLSLWMGTTKEVISLSHYLEEETRAEINALWFSYEGINPNRVVPATTRWQAEAARWNAFHQRTSELSMQHAHQGWHTFMRLSDARDAFPEQMSLWNDVYQLAILHNAVPDFTIIAVRERVTHTQRGPFLQTRWDQSVPFNNRAPERVGGPGGRARAGCTAIAMAQIMRFHRHPAHFDWANMPYIYNRLDLSHYYVWTPARVQTTAAFIRAIGDRVNISWGATSTGSTIERARDAFRNNFGYSSVVLENHNANRVASEFSTNRPVFMRGTCRNVNAGHAWVSDGVQDTSLRTEFFSELLLPRGDGFYRYSNAFSGNSPLSPNTISLHLIRRFHMNWGWGGHGNGWFHDTWLQVRTEKGIANFNSDRRNLYVRP